MRQGLSRFLEAAGFRILASTPRIHELVECSAQGQPDLLMIDATENSQSAIEQIELFKEEHPTGRIAVIAHQHQMEDLISASRAEADAYFSDVVTWDVFTNVLELVMLGYTILPPAFSTLVHTLKNDHDFAKGELDSERMRSASRSIGSDDVPRLSDKEKLVLRLLTEGASNKAIGRQINSPETTVKVHVKAIFRKIRVRNRTQAAIWATNYGSLVWRANTSSVPVAARASEAIINFGAGQTATAGAGGPVRAKLTRAH